MFQKKNTLSILSQELGTDTLRTRWNAIMALVINTFLSVSSHHCQTIASPDPGQKKKAYRTTNGSMKKIKRNLKTKQNPKKP